MVFCDKNFEIFSKLGSGELYFSAAGSRSFSMLGSYIDSMYAKLGFSKLIFLDNFDLYNNFLMSPSLNGAPERFYIIDIQNVQKNISSSREAVFEKNFCDLAYLKIEAIKLPLYLGETIAAFKEIYARLNLPVKAVISSGNSDDEKKGFFDTALAIIKSEGMEYDTAFSSDLNEYFEVKFYSSEKDCQNQSFGFILFDANKMLFSFTGGLEKILKKIFVNREGDIPFVVNPYQMVVITNGANESSNIYLEIDSLRKAGYSVIWHETRSASPLGENEYAALASRFKKAGAFNVLVLPNFEDSSKAFLYRGQNQKICGLDFFQLHAHYIQKDFKENYLNVH